MAASKEKERLEEDKSREKDWKRWGPYLSERQWGTVREDYSENGSCWDYFSHDQSRSRAYRWGEDGILGITDRKARLCFALGLWNEKDPILKERLFGLTGPEGNHGEDCKECYYYLDSTPTHSYMRALYKYPQSEFPYTKLVEENKTKGLGDPEYELEDTGVFDENRYWDIQAEYAKQGPEDILCKITVTNQGPEEATLHLLPTLWYRNTWSWGCNTVDCHMKPKIKKTGENSVECKHETPAKKEKNEKFFWAVDKGPDGNLPSLLFTENETNNAKLFGGTNTSLYVKDAFHAYIIEGENNAVNPKGVGTKVAAHYVMKVKGGEQATVRCRLYRNKEEPTAPIFDDDGFETVLQERKREAEDFYKTMCPGLNAEQHLVAKQAYAGLLWSKQFYHYVVKGWLEGDPDQPKPPDDRLSGRNHTWKHLYNRDVISMPDKWEYPWYASWDLAFHMVAMVKIDPDFAKRQLLLLLREWYMHPNGQIPAYEFAFSDVNPPVHAWAVRTVYEMAGDKDRQFLERCFQKLILNFTWWVNRKDPDGKNLFSGGFLGLDNIGVFDRSKPLPEGRKLYQADGTAWMAFFCTEMLGIALELASTGPSGIDMASEDMASKFFEHFVAIADAMNYTHCGLALWDEKCGFYYDNLTIGDATEPIRVRSMVGLVPLFACLVLDSSKLDMLEGFKHRMNWFIENRADVAGDISFMKMREGYPKLKLLAIPQKEHLERVLKYMLDENEFLSPFGIRSLSKFHHDNPFVLDGSEQRVEYTPGESNTYMFGGNSNWRGPVWLPVNFLIIESLERYDDFYGESLKVECPTCSGNVMRLKDVAQELARRLSLLFIPDENGKRPCHGENERYRTDPHWKDLVLFYEYFHGDTGRGCGASHQTGWTALVANCLDRLTM
ncbi:hypothetical protein Bbelb_100380 [Branchiostoma belcheri]|nr:hypothetical protein Bbelb_100380 [Branchiostoma belcheri]